MTILRNATKNDQKYLLRRIYFPWRWHCRFWWVNKWSCKVLNTGTVLLDCSEHTVKAMDIYGQFWTLSPKWSHDLSDFKFIIASKLQTINSKIRSQPTNMINNHNHWKNQDIVKNINQVISPPPACDKQEQKMLYNCQQIRVYIHHQSQNIAIYVHKILQKHEFSPRPIYNSLFVNLPKNATKNRINNVM